MGLLTVLLSACAPGTVQVESPTLRGPDARACARLVHALPRTVAGQPRRQVEATQRSRSAAWGDPAIVLRCGVGRPPGLTRFSTCQTVNGVDWFIPESQITGHPADILMTTVGRAQYVAVSVPRDYWPPAAAMVDLAPAVKHAIREVRPCR
jgi:hypothetical protein